MGVEPTGRRFPAPRSQCSLTTFVSAHRCGAVPVFHRSSLFVVASFDAAKPAMCLKISCWREVSTLALFPSQNAISWELACVVTVTARKPAAAAFQSKSPVRRCGHRDGCPPPPGDSRSCLQAPDGERVLRVSLESHAIEPTRQFQK